MTQQEIPTFKASARLVSVEVVARDHKGQTVPGLTANDFQVFEQVEPKREKHPQKIAAFRATSVAEIAAQDTGKVQMAPGVYTNLMTMNKVPVPPTILLVDGSNMDRITQMQVRQQMVRILASIPDDIPTAVYLLGRRLEMIQSFTTDPKLLRGAVQKISLEEQPTQLDPSHSDPDAMSIFPENSLVDRGPGPVMDAVREFEHDTFFMTTTTRVQETIDALRAVARHAAGYRGRKNLLWISSHFPIWPSRDFAARNEQFFATRIDWKDVDDLASALADARIAVYPMDASGLQRNDFSNQVAMQALLTRRVAKSVVTITTWAIA